VEVRKEVLSILDETLSLRGRALALADDEPLLGSMAELDSMAVVTLITTIEDRFGFAVGDDEISGATFATLGSLVRFVEEKLKT
jgi:acyl carrier protein